MASLGITLRFTGLVFLDQNASKPMPLIVFPTRTDAGGYKHQHGHGNPHRLVVIRRDGKWAQIGDDVPLPTGPLSIAMSATTPLGPPTLGGKVISVASLYGSGNPALKPGYGGATVLKLSNGSLDVSDPKYEIAQVAIVNDPTKRGNAPTATSVHASLNLYSNVVTIKGTNFNQSFTLVDGEALEFANSPTRVTMIHEQPNPDFEFYYSMFASPPANPVPVSVLMSLPPDPGMRRSPGIRGVPVTMY
jgi:hypothetical protein